MKRHLTPEFIQIASKNITFFAVTTNRCKAESRPSMGMSDRFVESL